MKLPFLHKIKLLWRYGVSNASIAFEIHEQLHELAYEQWKRFDWKQWLNDYRFNSTSPHGTQIRMIHNFPTEMTWHEYKTRVLKWQTNINKYDKYAYKARCLKSTPNVRPSCIDFKHTYFYEKHLMCVLPHDLYFSSNIGDNKFLHRIGQLSFEELIVHFDLEMPKISPIDLGCLLFLLWAVKSAYELKPNGSFFSYGCGKDTYKKFVDMLKTTIAFDEQLNSPKLKKAISVFAKWYHDDIQTITGVFSILANFEHKHYNSCFNPKSYKRNLAYQEIKSDIDSILDARAMKKLESSNR